MKKNTNITILILILTLLCTNAIVFADENWSLGGEINPSELDGASDVVSTGLGTLQWIGYLISIGMVIWVGIRYLLSGAGEKAKAKETLIPLVVGAFLIASATTIASVVFNF